MPQKLAQGDKLPRLRLTHSSQRRHGPPEGQREQVDGPGCSRCIRPTHQCHDRSAAPGTSLVAASIKRAA